MAVYTDVPDEDLTDFLEHYEIGTLLSMKGIAEGVENTNFLIHTTGGFYILTLYEKRVLADDLPFFLGLMQHLYARGLTCPQPVQGRDGAALRTLAGRPAAIVTFLDGVSVKRPGPGHCAAVGAALARLHLAGQDFGPRRPNALSLPAWRGLVSDTAAQADGVAPGLGARIAATLEDIEAEWPRQLPQGVIHADLFTDNVFFIGGELSGVIDFYFACNDALAYDLAICLNAWCFETDGSFDLTRGQEMIAGYERVRRLNDAEITALPILCCGAALRFLLTRLVDWLNVPPGALVRPKDPLEYDRKLGFHRRVSSARDYGLGR